MPYSVLRLALAAVLVLGACSPVVTHGPRVRPGGQVTLTGGTVNVLCDSPCDAGGVLPRFGVGARGGWTSRDGGGTGVLAGIAFPALDFAAPEVDVYVQPPAGPAAPVGGVGTLLSPRYAMPYAQLGHDPPRGRPGAYATVGYTWYFSHPSWLSEEPDSAYTPPRYFSPSVSLRLPMRRGGAMAVYVAGALGSYRDTHREYVGEEERVVTTRRPLRLLMTGVTFETSLGDVFEGFPRHPPGRPPTPPPFPN